MKKLTLIAASLLLAGVSAMAAEGQSLCLYTGEGSRIVYLLDELPQVTFSDQQMTVTLASGESASYAMADIDHWEFADDITTAIENVDALQSTEIRVYGDTVSVSNPVATAVTVYDLSGRQVAAAAPTQIAEFNIPSGIYIVTVGNQSFKIIK